jgi:hypothetical protein
MRGFPMGWISFFLVNQSSYVDTSIFLHPGKMECTLMSKNAFVQEWDTPEEDKVFEKLLEHVTEY